MSHRPAPRSHWLLLAALLAGCTAPPVPTPSAPPLPATVAATDTAAVVPPTTTRVASALPAACREGERPVLVLDGRLYAVVDTEALYHLGVVSTGLEPCPLGMTMVEGVLLGRLLKGSGDPVYWMEEGQRRWIPDMATFVALGHQTEAIATVPDDVLARWPLGAPLPAQTQSVAATATARPATSVPPTSPVTSPPPTSATSDTLIETRSIGAYTLRRWQPGPGNGLAQYATLTGADGAVTRVEAVVDVLASPAADLTGEGEPDVVFALNTAVGSHCCTGFAVYNLGASPVRVLENLGAAYDYSGRGSFVDLDTDGRFEVITYQRLTGIACSNAEVKVVAAYDPAAGAYRGASPRYPGAFAEDLVQLTAQAEATIETTRIGDGCTLYPLIATYLVLGQPDRAESELRRLYLGPDLETFWQALQTGVRAGRFFSEP